MTNWNLESFDYIYASLAQAAYTGRPIVFPYEKLSPDQQKALDSGQSIEFDFSQDVTYKYKEDGKTQEGITQGGQHYDSTDPNNDGIVYLQPDQKGLLEDKKTGCNAYYVSETETIDQTTQHTYFVVRGSDGMGKPSLEHPENFKNANDWINNDAAFALQDAIVPQAMVATKGMKEKIAELETQAAPEAKMSITGHSLGTMVSIQGAAGLNSQELDRVDQIVLFNGPDATKSLQKAGYSDEKIQQLSDKTTYYVNPLDPVSMLNRDKPYEEQLGTVHVIVPTDYTSMMEKGRSSHDFGAYQMDSHGNPLVASKDYHPELLTAGQDLAKLERDSIKEFKKYASDDVISKLTQMSPEEIKEFLTDIKVAGDKTNWDDINLDSILKNVGKLAGKAGAFADIAKKFGIDIVDLINLYRHRDDVEQIATDFQKDYAKLIKTTKAKSLQWSRDNIGNIQNQLQAAVAAGDYDQQILLRTELLYMATQLADADISEKTAAVIGSLAAYVADLAITISLKRVSISLLGTHLSEAEKSDLMSDLTLAKRWDEGIYSSDIANITQYQTNMAKFSQGLINCAQALEAVDSQGASDFDSLAIP